MVAPVVLGGMAGLWDRTSSRAQKALTYIPYNDQDGAARGASSFNIRRRNRGKNVGSFKTRKGQYVKGKGGRFVGSK